METRSTFLYPQDLVDIVSALVRDIVSSFESIVKNHRHLHKLTGTRIHCSCGSFLDPHDSESRRLCSPMNDAIRKPKHGCLPRTVISAQILILAGRAFSLRDHSQDL
ncbi:unnamed protein product [Penicillium crustosum]